MGLIERGKSFEIALSKLPLQMQWIEPGQFVMGCSGKNPHYIEGVNHELIVRFSQGFWVSRFPITVAQWRYVMRERSGFRFWKANKPKVQISWFEAMNLCTRITSDYRDRLPQGTIFRLPTEAEWEYCLKGSKKMSDTEAKYDLGRIAWHSQNTTFLKNVGMKEPTAWNLFDMQGNITEWCYDSAGYFRPIGTVTDYVSFYSDETRHVRGGAFVHNPSDFLFSECAGDNYSANSRIPWVGFRICLGQDYKPQQAAADI